MPVIHFIKGNHKINFKQKICGRLNDLRLAQVEPWFRLNEPRLALRFIQSELWLVLGDNPGLGGGVNALGVSNRAHYVTLLMHTLYIYIIENKYAEKQILVKTVG